MLRLLADENFDHRVVRGLRRLNPAIDVVSVQDVGLSGADDAAVLDWAAAEGRVLLTHDVRTMAHFAYERVRAGMSMPGVVEVSRRVPIGSAIKELRLVAEASIESDWVGQVRFLPLP